MPQLPHTPCLLLQPRKTKSQTHLIKQSKPPYTRTNYKLNKKNRRYRKLLRIGPSHFSKLLNSDPSAVLKAALVDKIRGLLTALGNDVIRAEVVGGCFEVREGEFRERWYTSRRVKMSRRRWVALRRVGWFGVVFFWVGFR